MSSNDDEAATTGVDIINAGSGDNRILAGLSGDQVTTLGGTDVVLGDNGELTYVNNSLTNAVSTETTLGGVDTLGLGEGDNIVIAGQGADIVTTGSGSDTVIGDSGEINYCRRRYHRLFSRRQPIKAAMTISPRLAVTIQLSAALVAMKLPVVAAVTLSSVIMVLSNMLMAMRFA